MQFKQEGAEI